MAKKKCVFILLIFCGFFVWELFFLCIKDIYSKEFQNDTEKTILSEIDTEADTEIIQHIKVPESVEFENGDYKVILSVSDTNPIVGEQVTFTIDLPVEALNQGVRVWETLNFSCIYNDWDGDKNAVTQITFDKIFDVEGTYPIAATIGDNETSHNILTITVRKKCNSEVEQNESAVDLEANPYDLTQLDSSFFEKIEKEYVSSGDSVSAENSLVQQYLSDSDYSDGKTSVADAYNEKVLTADYRTDTPTALAFTFMKTKGVVTLVIADDEKFQQIVYQNQVSGSEGIVLAVNLIPQQLYYYKIVDDGSNELETGSFYLDGNVRILLVDGIYNVRDLGGWMTQSGKTVKYNILFRGGEMNGLHDIHISDNGINTMRSQLNIHSEIDLRAKEELEDSNSELSELGEDIQYFRTGIVAYMIWDNEGTYYNVLRHIMNAVEAGDSVYFHCYGGADRTGTIAFLINGVLGVSENDLDRDFELTTMCQLRSKDDDDYVNMLEYIKSRQGNTLQEKFVSYFRELGFQQEEIDQFIDTMLE